MLLLPFITVALSSCHYFSRNSPFVNYHFPETGALPSTHGSAKLFRLSQQLLRPIQYGLGHVAAAGKPGQLLTALFPIQTLHSGVGATVPLPLLHGE